MAYEIKVEAFEGPFDLLLHLININEIEIHDIPIHQITRTVSGIHGSCSGHGYGACQ